MLQPSFDAKTTPGIETEELTIPDYELLRPIGAGSYGEVWLARNVVGGFRAIKVVRRGRGERDSAFEREFAGIKNFEPVSRSQENLVTIFHVGRNESKGLFYYAMELADDVRGEGDWETYQPKTLASEMGRRGRLGYEECLRVSLALTDALGNLHRLGLIHRDV